MWKYFRGFLITRLGIDKKVFSGLLTRMVTMVLGPIGSAVIVLNLTAEIQGIYYLFLSILALRAFFELGVGLSITQVAAHSKLVDSFGNSFIHPATVIAANRWMAWASLMFACLVGLGGSWFLLSQGYSKFSILGAWILYVGVSSIQFYYESRWALLQGADYVVESNRLRLFFQISLYVFQWLLISVGFGLFSFSLACLFSVIINISVFKKKFTWLYPNKCSVTKSEIRSHREGIISLVKRSSQTFLSGYFVYQLQQPICFAKLGAESSAKLGFTLVVGLAVISLPAIWVQSSFPLISSQIASGNVTNAWEKFRETWIRSSLLTLGALLFAVAAVEILRVFSRFSERLMGTESVIILFIGLSIQAVSQTMTYWPRAHKTEPFIPIAYTQMIITPILMWVLISRFGLAGVGWATIFTWIVGFGGIYACSKSFFPEKTKST